ncbi:hypothetical protein [Leifsonia sp. LS1]|uniref:hypothetical protein n=1 Tax=Leifsonia sp. LS1 TaxID=2828483 RepID=UPI001CFEC185|nr:hypothetical protein [Leifsonia sp. LS1]
MTHRITRLMTATALAGLAVFLGVLQALAPSSAAQALSGAGHGPGYLSSDGWWLGTYRLDDGAQGFCLHAGRLSPTGHPLQYADGAALGWFGTEESARLAYISRTWAGTDDRLTAAAGQIATWMVAGLGGRTPEAYAARAGADAGSVLALAHAMVEESAREATTSVRAEAVVELAETGPGRVRVDVTAERLSGAELLPAAAHSAVVQLDGARFADGATTATVETGRDVPIVPDGQEASVSVTATASLDGLPYGTGLRVAVSPNGEVQSLLMAVPAATSASAGANTAGPSPLPFQPRVETTTSAAVATVGDSITDVMNVSVDSGDGLLPAWGVRASDDGFIPIEVTIVSSLLGPFSEPIVRAERSPADAPVVCTVETAVDGTGTYQTPACVLPAPGYYVWVERIDPERTEPALGGARVLPWSSPFGVASEITRAEAPAVPSHAAPAAAPTAAELADTGAAPGVVLGGGLAGIAATAAGVVALATGARSRRSSSRHRELGRVRGA